MKKPQIKILKNGLSIVTIPTDSPSVTVMSLVNTGSYYEDKSVNGISHFLEHMCFKGTEKQTGKEIMRYLDGLGAETNAFTSHELTGYYVKSVTKHWKKTLAVVSDIFLNSTFPETELEREKGVIIGEIGMYEDMPMRQVHDLFNELVYGNQAAGRTVLGTRENITTMSRDNFIQYHNKHYVANATTIVVAGNLQHRDVAAEVTKNFAGISTAKKKGKKKISTQQSKTQIKIHTKKTDQTHIVMGYRSVGYHHKDAVIVKMISSILGSGMSSRLFEKLREDMGVGYYVHANNASNSDTGVLQVSCGVDSKRVGEVLQAIYYECNRLRTELVSDTELKRVQEFIIGNTQMSLESTDDRAYYYGQRHLFGLDIMTSQEFIRIIKSISPHDIRRVAKRLIKDEQLNIAMIGPHTQKQSTIFKKAMKKNIN